jgi:microcystin-dependent protein
MSDPYIGEIRMFAGNFAPVGWAFCAGQMLPISENDALFNLIGTTYGGDGQTTFGLPDLRGRIPLHQGAGMTLGGNGGAENVTLTATQLPAHSHPLMASTGPGNVNTPGGNVTAESAGVKIYYADEPTVNLAAGACSSVGGSQPHDNFQPYLCINFIVALSGIYPSPS